MTAPPQAAGADTHAAGIPSRVVMEDVADVVDRAAPALRLLEGSTVLVAGGAGFLPSYLVDALVHANDALLARPCRVVVVDNLITGAGSRLAHLVHRPDVRFVERDVSAGWELDEPVHYVVHGASVASPTWYRRHPLETIDANVSGTRNLLDVARRNAVRGFLYLSSSEIYGNPPVEHVPTPEDYWGHVSSTGPRACYDESKRLAETLCMTYHRLYGVPVRIIRPFNVYGPRLRLDDGRVVPDLVSNVVAGEPITLYSDGRVTRSFCYVSDAASAMLLLLVFGGSGEAYNVGNDEEVTIRRLAETVDALRADPTGVVFAENSDPNYLADNPERRCPDLRKTKAAIDWSPRVDLRAGLERTYRFYTEEVEA